MGHRTQHGRAKWDLEGGVKASGCAGGQVGYRLWCPVSSWKRCLSGALIPPGPILHTGGV